MITDAPNLNILWAELIVEELVRNGVDRFVISPGSRSTPLTVATARNPKAKTTVHYDERGAAFFALGVAKALGQPCALICTSGTAVANYFPAIAEASMSYVPLVVLTADRPPELQNTGANQTIDQAKIYGAYVRHFVAMPCPDGKTPLEYVLTTIDHAVAAARRSPSGPVHINCAYREPLAPVGEPTVAYADTIQAWKNSAKPYTTYVECKIESDSAHIEFLAQELQQPAKVLVVFGQDEFAGGGQTGTLEVFRNWPIFRDVTSTVADGYEGSNYGACIACYDLLLQSRAFKDLCQPDAVIHLGGSWISKCLQEHLATVKPRTYVRVSGQHGRIDPNHIVTHRFQCTTEAFLRAWGAIGTHTDSQWAIRLEIASERAQKAIWETLKGRQDFSEIEAIIALAELTRRSRKSIVFAANSMPVRYLDMYGGISSFLGPAPMVIANRGASGIDGNIATVAGYSKACNLHVTAVIGDLAVLHDLSSLALLKQDGVHVTLIVLNNDGGGIFHFLPIAEHKDVFEKYFATPHGLHFEDAARMFGLPYARPTTKDEFIEAYSETSESGGSSIIEVVTDREENVRLHRKIGDAVVKALEDL